MSYENRKREYERLVNEAKGFKAEADPFFKISQALREEFGEPKMEEEAPVEEQPAEPEQSEEPAEEEVPAEEAE